MIKYNDMVGRMQAILHVDNTANPKTSDLVRMTPDQKLIIGEKFTLNHDEVGQLCGYLGNWLLNKVLFERPMFEQEFQGKWVGADHGRANPRTEE